MGLLTFSINVTLDGCVDHQEGIADDETHAFFTRLMDEGGAMLWGRVTYEMMESYWPAVARGDEEAAPAMREWAVKLEAKPKYVVSSTRKDFPWTNSHHIAGDLRTGVQKLKDATPAGVLLGSGKLATELDRLDLIDEYIHDDIARVGGDDDDRHLLTDVGERRQQPVLAGGLPHTECVVAPIQLVKLQLHRRPVSGASRLGLADASPPAPHATARRRCSAARTPDGPRPAPQRRVCRIEGDQRNPDPSRGDGDACDTPADGRDDRDGLQDSVGGAGGPHARTCAAPHPGTRASSRRVRDRRRGRSQTAAHTPGRCVHEGPTPRGRSAERAPSATHGNIMGE